MGVGRHGAVVGATASGKSTVALDLARRDPSWEIVTVDSMQVYRGMDIGTAKPTPAERAEVPHHLLDVADPSQDYDVASYQRAARQAIADIEDRGHRALLVGGTALYLRAVVDDLDIPGVFPDVRAVLDAEPDTASLHERLTALDPVAAARMEPSNRRRILRALEVTLGSGRPFSSYGPGLTDHAASGFTLVGVRWPMVMLDQRIEARFETQMRAGLLDEVRRLAEGPTPWSRTASQALGYRELAAHVRGETTLDDAVALAVARTRRFARRQRSWFRRDPRIAWVDGDADSRVARAADLLG